MTNGTMQAVVLREFGGPEVLHTEEVAVPEPAPGEVLVRVHAAALNPPDWYLREGMPDVPTELRPPLDLPMILGTDVSGVVAAVADGVTEFAVGDEVSGMLRFPLAVAAGAYTGYATAPVTDIARKPASVDHVHAAAVPMAALTAWQFLVEPGHDAPSPFQAAPHRPVPLGLGSRVLVNGAAGGVGHFAVQIAKGRGAHVIAVASGRHARLLRELGADEVVDYTRERPEDVVRDVDVVLDCVGGPASAKFLRTLRRGGALYPVYFARLDPAEVAAAGVTVSSTQVRASGAQMATLARLIDAGLLSPVVDSTFGLVDAAKAHERAAHGHIEGKIVLAVDV